jgi:hypothetical protein
MPSQQDPSDIETGPGKLPIDVATAATNLFASSTSSVITSLSDLSNREIAVPTFTGATAFSDLSSITLSSGAGPFFVGSSGSDPLTSLFRVVVGSGAQVDQELFNPVTGLYVQVASISPATVGTGFYTGGLTLTLTTPIPTGTAYKVYYARRSTLGGIPANATSFPAVLRSADRTRFPEFDRLGVAPTSIAAPRNLAINGYLDPFMAQWKAVLRGTTSGSDPAFSDGGSIGFVNVGRKKNVNDAEDQGLTGHQAAGFLSAYIKETSGSGTIGGANPLTRINPANACIAISSADVQLAVGDFFRTTTASAFRPGLDMLEVTRASGIKETYVVSMFDATDVRRATLRTLGGGVPLFTVSEAIHCRWIRPNYFVGGDNDIVTWTLSAPERFLFSGMGYYTPGPITDNSAAEHPQEPPFFGASRNTRTGGDSARGYWDVIALRWGGFNVTDPVVAQIGRRDTLGELWGDGSIETYGGRIRGLKASRADQLNVGATQTYTWTPNTYQQVTFICTTNSATNLTIAFASTYTPVAGDRITFFLDYSAFGLATIVTFPASFKFSGNDGITPLLAGTIARFEGVYSNGNFYFTRTDY